MATINKRRKLATYILYASVYGSALSLMGCSSGEEREAKYFERAKAAYEAGDYEKARVDLKNVLQINTSNAKARLLFARIEEMQQNWPQMYANLSAAVESDPTLWDARVKLAELLVASNQIDKANEQVNAVLAKEPNHADALGVRAGILFREKQMVESELLCQKILSSTPGHITATGLLAAIYGDSDPAKAVATIEDGLRLNPGNTTLQLLRIQLLTRMGDSTRVISAYQDLIKQTPDALIYPAQLAAYLNGNNQNAEAEEVLQQMLQRNPESDQAKLIFVDFLARTREPAEALAALKGFSEKSPENYPLQAALANLHIALKNYDDAEKLLNTVIDKDPKSANAIDARNRLIKIYLGKRDRDTAEKLLDENIAIEPENEESLLVRARLQLADNNADGAIADLRSILKNSPNSIPAIELLAIAQERSGAQSLALDSYQHLLQLNGSNLTGLTGAARLLMAQEKLDEAKDLLTQAHKLAPQNFEVTRQLVQILARQQQWDAALEITHELLQKQETAAAGHYLSGLVLESKGETGKAIEAMKNSINKEPTAVEPLQALLRIYLANNQLDSAVEYAEKHVHSYPQQIHAQEFLAALYKQVGRLNEAEVLLRKIIEVSPAQISAYRELSAVLIAAKKRDQVAGLLEKGLEKNPNNPGLQLMLAELYQSEGKNDLAIAIYERMEQLLPKSDIVRNNLALLLVEQSPSEENLRRALRLTADFDRSNNPIYLDTLGWLHVKNGNIPQAISLLEDAVRRQPAPELRYHLGVAYVRNNMPDKGREQLELATQGDVPFPWREDAELELSRIP